MFAALVLGEKLLDGGEHHAAGRDGEKFFQMVTVLRLHRFLPEQFMAAGKRAEKLVVEVVPVGENDERGIFHRRLDHEPPGVKRHCQRLARSLGVPNHADPFVAGFAAGLFLGKVAAAFFQFCLDPVH